MQGTHSSLFSFAHSLQTAAGFTIPAGHQVCVSPTVNHRLYDTWDDRMEFKPDRYLGENPAAGEKFAYVPFGAGRRKTDQALKTASLALANAAFSFLLNLLPRDDDSEGAVSCTSISP